MGRCNVSTERNVLSEIICGHMLTSPCSGGNVFRAAVVLWDASESLGGVHTQGLAQGEVVMIMVQTRYCYS